MKEEILQHRFSRLERIINIEGIDILKSKCVLIIGLGGVGGYALESLVRSGIGKVIIVDFDKIDVTNINRQIVALDSTVGEYKVDVFESRIKDINPLCEVIKIKEFIDKDNIDLLFKYDIDYLIDACDTVNTKKAIIMECLSRGIKFISSMGTGNKLDPSQLEIIDIRKTVNDPLARIMRKFIKDSNIKDKILVLSSKELPIKTCDGKLGSSMFVPSSAGILMASYIVRKFIKKQSN